MNDNITEINKDTSVSYTHLSSEVSYPTVDSTADHWTGASFTAVTPNLYYNGDHLGTLSIPSIGLNVKVYQGTDSARCV